MRSTSMSYATSFRLAGIGLIATFVVLGCAGQELSGPPPEVDAVIELRGSSVTPAAIGAVVELFYTVDVDRGTPHTMQRWDGAAWTDMLIVVATEDAERAASAIEWQPPDQPLSVNDIGFGGVGGGLFVKVPTEVDGHFVRICTGEVAREEQACTSPLDYT